jgi:hypothetical protein
VEGLSAHLVVRNEPFVYYAAMSVYPFVERMLLWDTGSYDKYTLQDIEAVLAQDTAKKIDYRQVKIQTDETAWCMGNWKKERARNRGKTGVGHARQWQIDATHTRFFLIVDGDEVHYESTLRDIRGLIQRRQWDRSMICAGIPLRWFDTPDTWFHHGISGRVFRTDGVEMMKGSPGEMHCLKGTQKPLNVGVRGRINIKTEPYAHFETMLKPWRRKIDRSKIKPWTGKLPEIMRREPKYLERFMREFAGKKTKAEIDGRA